MAAVTMLMAASTGCALGPGHADCDPDGCAATVAEVVDGDTIVVELGGQRETVRFIGIDTPETKHPTKPVECYGPEASERTAGLVPPGTSVVLLRDAEARDRFGRLLAYVHRADDDLFVNLVLVEEGFARTLAIPPNTTLEASFGAAGAAAMADGRGLWGACQ